MQSTECLNKLSGVRYMATGCTNYYYKNSKCRYHRLPVNNKAKLAEGLQKNEAERPPASKYSQVCSEHFLEADYERKGVFRDGAFTFVQSSNLKETAVPSIFDFLLYRAGATDAPSANSLLKEIPRQIS